MFRDVNGCCVGYFWNFLVKKCEGRLLKMFKKFVLSFFAAFTISFYKLFWLNLISFLCIECAPGFTGVNCTSPCYYPSYGRRCQTNCNCRKKLCDIATGCRTVTTGHYIYTLLKKIVFCEQSVHVYKCELNRIGFLWVFLNKDLWMY